MQVRLGVMWSGLEPVEGRYDQEYLEVLRKIIRLVWVAWDSHWGLKLCALFRRNFAAHGISVILDLHQVTVSLKSSHLKKYFQAILLKKNKSIYTVHAFCAI